MPNIAHIQQYVSIGKDIVEGIATIIASVFAWRGFNAWHRQLVGNANYDVGRQLTRAAINLENAVIELRIQAELSSEKSAEITTPGNNTSDLKYRWEYVTRTWEKLDEAAMEAQTIWGPESRYVTDALSASIRNLGVSVKQYSEWMSERPHDPEWMKLHSVVVGDVSDEFGKAFAEKVKAVTDYAWERMNKPQIPNK